jgi:hypothetical protein
MVISHGMAWRNALPAEFASSSQVPHMCTETIDMLDFAKG